MSALAARMRAGIPRSPRAQERREGLGLLAAVVVVMWVVEAVNALDSYRLNSDGIWPRNASHLWGIFTAPFLHAGVGHLLANTIPLLVLGAIIALRGAARLALITLIVIVASGLGTWATAPAHSITVGASGIVFGYAAYLFARGFFDHSLLELLVGLVVGVLWGGALLASLVPHGNISWQAHAFGAVGGVLAAWLLRRSRGALAGPAGRRGAASAPPSLPE